MDGRIDPPSSMHRLTLADIAEQCQSGEVWVCGDPPQACIFLTERDGRLYLGKLSVEAALRGRGVARALVDLAEARARMRGIDALELDVRIELVENHATFERLGFEKVAARSHQGFDTPTYFTMRKGLDPVAQPGGSAPPKGSADPV